LIRKARQQVKISRATRIASKTSSDIESRIGNLLSRFNDEGVSMSEKPSRYSHAHHHPPYSLTSIPSATQSTTQSSGSNNAATHDEDDAPARFVFV